MLAEEEQSIVSRFSSSEMYAYFPMTIMSGAGSPLPLKTGDVEIKSGRQLTAEDIRKCEGMIIDADPLAGVANAQVQDDLTLLDNAGVQRYR